MSPSSDVAADLVGRPADRLGRLERRSRRRRPPAATAAAARPRQEVVAPGDRAAQRLLALGQVARARGQHAELLLEAAEDRVGRQELGPGRRQLDRERHAVEPGADRGDGRGVVVRDLEVGPDGERPRDEQPDGLVLGHEVGGDRPLFAREVQLLEVGHREQATGAGRPGTGYSCSPEIRSGARLVAITRSFGAARRRSAMTGAGVDDLLEVVEDEQHLALRQPLHELVARRLRRGLGKAERRRDPRRNEGRIADRLERDEPCPVVVLVGDVGGELERQPGLARPARTGQREQPRLRQQLAGLLQLRVPADEARELRREVVGPAVERPDRREVDLEALDRELADALRAEVLEPVLAEAPERDAGWQRPRHPIRRDLREQDLAAVAGAADPGRPMDVGADVLAVGVERAVARVEAHPDPPDFYEIGHSRCVLRIGHDGFGVASAGRLAAVDHADVDGAGVRRRRCGRLRRRIAWRCWPSERTAWWRCCRLPWCCCSLFPRFPLKKEHADKAAAALLFLLAAVVVSIAWLGRMRPIETVASGSELPHWLLW